MNRATLALLLTTVASFGATGCRPDFAPFNRLTALRVLGIQSEPPTPLTGESATLSALVFTPTPDPTLTYKWSWCPVAAPADDGFGCLITEEKINKYLEVGGLPPVPSFDLGSDVTATLPNTIAPAALQAGCSGLLPNEPSEIKVDCTAGFPAQVALTVTTATDSVTTVQTVKLRFDPATPANTNPVINGLFAIQDGATQPIDDLGGVTLPREVETSLITHIDPSVSEAYADGTDANGLPVTSHERLFTTWFVETGDTHDQRTSYINGSTNFDDLLTNSWTPPPAKNYPGTTARIYTVLHDNRGGVSWLGGTVTLGASP